MRALTLDVNQSAGRILCCTIFRPGGRKLLAKGHILSDEDIRLLETEGMQQVWVTEREEGEIGEDEARENDLEAIFAFTYVEQFFSRLGFEVIERGELPLKAWKDCLRCPKFQNCDEIAVLKRLRQSSSSPMSETSESTRTLQLVQLPTVSQVTFR